MSEFTYGNIIRAIDKPKLFGELPSGTPVFKLSGDWIAFFTSEDGEFMASEKVKGLSDHCPIFYFTNLEDHGWGFRIFHKGEVVAKLQVLYELVDGELDGIVDECEEDEVFGLDGIISQNLSAEAFKVFGLRDEQINSIVELLAGNLTVDEEGLVTVEKFKELLGIGEMSWIRYERTEDREGIEYV